MPLTILYGDIVLDLDSALFGDELDRGFGRPALDFDPTDIPRLNLQDAIFASTGDLPRLYADWYIDVLNGITEPRWRGSDIEYARYLKALRNACLLPLSERFIDALADLLTAWGEPELQRRLAKKERARDVGEGEWETADLRSEVEAVCGEGRKAGRQYWFHCPFGHEDTDASLEVDADKRVFHCFGCGRKGGLYAWRAAIRGLR